MERFRCFAVAAIFTAVLFALPSPGWSSWDPDGEDTSAYCVTKNFENQYSIWPQGHETPLGWTSVGVCGSKRQCLDWIEANWTDKRPPALRKKMCEMCARENGLAACHKECDEFLVSCRLSWRFLPRSDAQPVPPVKILAVDHGGLDTLTRNAGGPDAPGASGVVESQGINGACNVAVVLAVQRVGQVRLVRKFPNETDECAVNRRGTWIDGWASGECSRVGPDIMIRVAP